MHPPFVPEVSFHAPRCVLLPWTQDGHRLGRFAARYFRTLPALQPRLAREPFYSTRRPTLCGLQIAGGEKTWIDGTGDGAESPAQYLPVRFCHTCHGPRASNISVRTITSRDSISKRFDVSNLSWNSSHRRFGGPSVISTS